MPLQWSHGILAMESPDAAPPAGMDQSLQWSHGILAMESRLNAFGSCQQIVASMEPWHFSHGEIARNALTSINEAASMEPWHFSHGESMAVLRVFTLTVLQWSHGILAMERRSTAPFCACGVRLQWSHGILAMERQNNDSAFWANFQCFNGAMAF